MMELALLRTLLSKDFYDTHKGIRCPDSIFSKDVRKIKQTVDMAMDAYEKDLTVSDVEALFYTTNQSMTTANKTVYADLFRRMEKADPINTDIADTTLSKMFQQYVGEKVANLGFEFVNGTQTNIEPLRALLDKYNDNFTPNIKVKWD
jgi:ribosomal protein S3AE